MRYAEQGVDVCSGRRNGGARLRRPDPSYLADLVQVLSQHPGGLRRWSVMRAIRKIREGAGQDISLKFEDEVERVFRSHCESDGQAKVPAPGPANTLFYRPRDKAGEVWAVFPDRAQAWTAGETPSEDA